MKIFKTVTEMQAWSSSEKRENRDIAFVPTMGALHEGHLELLRRGKEAADRLVLSLFVNPTQFGPREDLDSYPRTLKNDLQKAEAAGVDAVFLPSSEEMYPRGFQTFIQLENLPNHLCGIKRPGHFRGVTTVVLKLFMAVNPDVALFGKKDYQQFRVIQQMTADLRLPIRILPVDIVREKDGLAMSSRNLNLSPEEREATPRIFQSLVATQRWIDEGERKPGHLESRLIRTLTLDPKITVDYVAICDPQTLEPLKKLKPESLLAIACFVGQTRLIDNVLLKC